MTPEQGTVERLQRDIKSVRTDADLKISAAMERFVSMQSHFQHQLQYKDQQLQEKDNQLKQALNKIAGQEKKESQCIQKINALENTIGYLKDEVGAVKVQAETQRTFPHVTSPAHQT
eukprot:Filipodium_phascolosomae@DN2028_c0_g1_i1.p1